MAEQTKPLLKSKTVIGVLTAAIPLLDQVYAHLSNLPAAAIPAPVSMLVTGLGLLLSLYGRLSKNIIPIAGIVSSKK